MIRDLAFTPDRRLLASGSMDGTVWLWDLAERRALNRLDNGSEDAVITIAFSPDGQVLASAGGNPNASNPDNTIRLWDTLSGELLNTLEGHTTTVGSLTFSPQGELLASAGDDRSVRLWGVSAFARG
jgi:WD40 repeat protein